MSADGVHRQRFALWAGVCVGTSFVTMLVVLTLVAVVFTEPRSQAAPSRSDGAGWSTCAGCLL